MDRQLMKQHVKQLVRGSIGEPYVGKRLKLRRVAPALRELGLDPHDILDAGAEDATFVYWLADRYPRARVTAVDIDESAMQACRSARPKRYADRVRFRAATFAELDAFSFDLITAFDVLEHITDDAAATADLYRVLRPGGTLLVHVPRDQWTDRHGRIERVPDAEAWRINPGHVRMGYSPERLRALLTASCFDVADTQLWIRRNAVIAHSIYKSLESPRFLRLLSVPVSDIMSVLDRRRPPDEGNSVWAVAHKPSRTSAWDRNA